jgi:hypothetical protein
MIVTDNAAVRKYKFHANNTTIAQNKIFFNKYHEYILYTVEQGYQLKINV